MSNFDHGVPSTDNHILVDRGKYERICDELERLKWQMQQLREAIPRALIMLKAAEEFAYKNADFGLTAHYDEVDCDGYCISDECGFAHADLNVAFEIENPQKTGDRT